MIVSKNRKRFVLVNESQRKKSKMELMAVGMEINLLGKIKNVEMNQKLDKLK